MNENVILIPITRHEFKELVKGCVSEVLEKVSKKTFDESEDKPLSLKQTSQYLNMAEQTIYGYTSRRLIPFIKKGRKLFFRKSDLDKWLSDGSQKTMEEMTREADQYVPTTRRRNSC